MRVDSKKINMKYLESRFLDRVNADGDEVQDNFDYFEGSDGHIYHHKTGEYAPKFCRCKAVNSELNLKEPQLDHPQDFADYNLIFEDGYCARVELA